MNLVFYLELSMNPSNHKRDYQSKMMYKLNDKKGLSSKADAVGVMS